MHETPSKPKSSPVAIAVIISCGVIFMLVAMSKIGGFDAANNGPPPNSVTEASPDRAGMEPDHLRGLLTMEYLELMKGLNPNYNYLDTKLQKGKGGFTLYAVHPFFNRYEFHYGRSANAVSTWIDKHKSELRQARIVAVGVKSTRPAGDYVSLPVE